MAAAKKKSTKKTAKAALAPGTDSVDERITKELAASGLKKRQAGGTPTAREQAAIRKLEKQREEEQRWQYYRTVPKKHWNLMSGRVNQVLKKQAEIHGIPLDGATIDLTKVVRWLHDFLAANRIILMRDEDEDAALMAGEGPAIERWRLAKAQIAEIELEQKRQRLLPIDEIHRGLARSASIMRRAGERLERLFGPDARKIFDEAIDNAIRTAESGLGEIETDGDRADGEKPKPKRRRIRKKTGASQ
jgi:phage terminase Nu1 subunit (DNA packaging protein)